MVFLVNEIKKGKFENIKLCCKELLIKKNNILYILLYFCMLYYKLW